MHMIKRVPFSPICHIFSQLAIGQLNTGLSELTQKQQVTASEQHLASVLPSFLIISEGGNGLTV